MSSDWFEVEAKWQGDLTFMGKNDLDNTIQMGSKQNKDNISPMELLLLGLAGCTGYDVVSILKKKRLPLLDFKVKVRGIRDDDYPMVYTHIEVEYLFWGFGLSEKAVTQAIELSETKYCSASVMLGKTAQIKSSFQIFETTENA
jgi:putative redox protein